MRAGLLAALAGAVGVGLVLVGVLGVEVGPALGAAVAVGLVLGCAVWLTRARAAARDMTSEAARYRLGARSERRIGRVLDTWGRLAGWRLWHDRALPGVEANVDHLALSAGGAVVNVDSKWRAPSSRVVWDRRSGRLAVGSWSGDDLVRSALTESAVLSRVLGVAVTTVVVVDGVRIPRARLGSRAPIRYTVRGGRHRGAVAVVLGRSHLPAWLWSHRSTSGPVRAADIEARLSAR